MEVTAGRYAGLANFADRITGCDALSLPDKDLRKVSIQGIEVILMFDHDQVSIVIRPGAVDRLAVRSGENHCPISGGMDRRAELVQKFHPAVRITRPVGGGGIAIRRVY